MVRATASATGQIGWWAVSGKIRALPKYGKDAAHGYVIERTDTARAFIVVTIDDDDEMFIQSFGPVSPPEEAMASVMLVEACLVRARGE